MGRLYARPYFECGVAYEFLKGDTVIKPGVATLATPGHGPVTSHSSSACHRAAA